MLSRGIAFVDGCPDRGVLREMNAGTSKGWISSELCHASEICLACSRDGSPSSLQEEVERSPITDQLFGFL